MRIEAEIPAEVEEAEIVEPQDAIGYPALDRGDRRLLVIEEEKLQRLDAGRATPVMGIGFHHQRGRRDQVVHDEGTGAVEFDAGILRARFEHDDLVLCQAIEKVGIGRLELNITVWSPAASSDSIPASTSAIVPPASSCH